MAHVTVAPAAPRRDEASLPVRLDPPLAGGWRGWVGPLAATVVGGIIRFADLGRPHAIMFDETYYAKEGISLLRFGYEVQTVEKANEIILASNGDWRTLDIFKDAPAFVVHPPFGKWTIGAGEFLFGATPFGWRFAVAVLGTLSILLTARIMRRMTRSDLIGTLAGLLLAVEGLSIVMSRIALLDMVLAFWALAAFGFLILDRDQMRRRLAAYVTANGLPDDGWGPRIGFRPYRWAAGISLGLCCGVKWSGIWFVAVFGLMTVLWEVGARRAVGVRRPYAVTFVRSAFPAFVSIVVVAVVVYVSTWVGWFIHPDAWGREWGMATQSWIPQPLRALWHYHAEAWNFSVNLTGDHSYQSNAMSWLLQLRPVSMFWDGKGTDCGASSCAAAVTGLGNPIIWWVGTVALAYQLWRWAARRDWRSGAILAGIVAGWMPWLIFLDRTIFSFYAIAFTPFVVMGLAMTLGAMLGRSPETVPDDDYDAVARRRTWGAVAAGSIVLLAVIAAWWFYPVWTAIEIPYDMWRLRMWMPTWV